MDGPFPIHIYISFCFFNFKTYAMGGAAVGILTIDVLSWLQLCFFAFLIVNIIIWGQ